MNTAWKTAWEIAKKTAKVAIDMAGYKEGWEDAMAGEQRKLNIGPAGEAYQLGYDDALAANTLQRLVMRV